MLTQLGKPFASSTGVTPITNYALQFDGSQNYVNLGTMGTFGADASAGFYTSFDIRTTSTTVNRVILGTFASSNKNTIRLFYNSSVDGGATGRLEVQMYDNLSHKLDGYFTNATISDGTRHQIILTATPSTNTITALVDGATQTITYKNLETPSSFVNFPNNFVLGANNNNGTPANFIACVLDNVQLGVAANNLYGSYSMDEGAGTTTADSSGKGNTGTLTGTPVPTWITF